MVYSLWDAGQGGLTEYNELSQMDQTIHQDISHMTLLHVEQIDVRRMDYRGDQQT